MEIVRLEEADKFENSDKCKGIEYKLNDKDINFAIAQINGRYPDQGYCMNEECKELIYVMEGKGTINKKDEIVEFKKGDVLLIDKKEIFYWDGKFTIIMPCIPAWYPEQHKMID